jgi:16S rRNA (uracil1498-N3)-methyltransferase
MIGPEGGFKNTEIEMAGKAGFIPVSVGRRILRAETAALILVAIVQYEWGDLGRT